MKQTITFSKEYTLPSRGLIYENSNSFITLRGMNEEEVKELSNVNNIKEISNIIDSCIISDNKISSYDMTVGDFDFLLIKMKSLTYGTNISRFSSCPNCGFKNEYLLNTSGFDIKEFNEEIKNEVEKIYLNKRNITIKLKFSTPSLIDSLKNSSSREFISKHIYLVNDKAINEEEKEELLNSLSLLENRLIIKQIEKMDNSIGIVKEYKVICGNCKKEYKSYL